MFLDCENTDIEAFKSDKWSFSKRNDYLIKRKLFSEDQTQMIAVGRIEDRDFVVGFTIFITIFFSQVSIVFIIVKVRGTEIRVWKPSSNSVS